MCGKFDMNIFFFFSDSFSLPTYFNCCFVSCFSPNELYILSDEDFIRSSSHKQSCRACSNEFYLSVWKYKVIRYFGNMKSDVCVTECSINLKQQFKNIPAEGRLY